MSNAHLRFSTDILARLGEELNPSPAQGLLELVKNAYDADATKCLIVFSDTHLRRGSVTINDDGIGMDQDSIIDGWLMLGRSKKQSTSQTSKYSRHPAGNKGLGRLAALRMGQSAALVTRPESEPGNEYSLELKWEDFEKKQIVEDVVIRINKRKVHNGWKNGTEITVRDLHAPVGRHDIKRLARDLLLLADPFTDSVHGFDPVLKAPEFEDLEKLVRQRYFDDATYHLHGELDKKGFVRAWVTDWKGKQLYSADHARIRRKDRCDTPFRCPAAEFDLWIYILNPETFSLRASSVGDVRSWLKEFGGVHIYINGIRIAPYGNPGNDWLDMNLSRVRSPELRPATNSSIGRITIRRPENTLIQKTDRSGLLEDDSFYELKAFAIESMEWLTRQRLSERENKRRSEREEVHNKSDSARQNVAEAIASLPPQQRHEIEASFEKYDRSREREVRSLQKDVQLYRTMSTVGITAAVFAHEAKHPLQIINRDAGQIEKRTYSRLNLEAEELIGRQLHRIRNQVKALQAFGDLTLNLISKDKRRSSRVELHTAISSVFKMFAPLINERQVNTKIELDEGNPFLLGSETALESIISNLLTNSLKAFETCPPNKRLIRVTSQVTEKKALVYFLDNGPGIQGISTQDIWLPGESTFDAGTGLGLTIVRDSVVDMGGTVSVVERGELGGATFIISLPIIGV